MRRKTFLQYFMAQVIVIFVVMALFKWVENRQIAATLAGLLFVILPTVQMIKEYQRAELEEQWWFVAVLQFWTLFALPILWIRLTNWGVPFDQLSLIGIPGPVIHSWSSKSYTAMMILTIWTAFKTKKAGS
ncbi:hypothetical protein [Bdellovibrio sp. HCB2-146]|uniref:hypothetical protein n=1 Tax=Bdellovibrio sp. HCB2-146 TaxID=3394362 RepID=UPI0039BC7087